MTLAYHNKLATYERDILARVFLVYLGVYKVPSRSTYYFALALNHRTFPLSSGSVLFSRCAKLTKAILLKASACLFWLLGTYVIENDLKRVIKSFALLKYSCIASSFA
ncbi:hypothetical protein Tco_1053493 [Tanacetum coccineum]|uniref:Uncharacterized protein n=1 Tax=Tanacetum coccineum TaxID=301880 RepID=A0ABQ5GVA0_9ASTR